MASTSSLNRAFAAELQRARNTAKLTQDELAYQASIDRTYVSLLERGKNNPSLDVLFRICEALGREPDEFVARVRERLDALSARNDQQSPEASG